MRWKSRCCLYLNANFLKSPFFISVTNSVLNNDWRFTVLRLTCSCVNFNQERGFFPSDMQKYLLPLFLIVVMATCLQLIRLSCKQNQLGERFILSVFFQIYLQLLHVSDFSRSIIRRNNCICATLGTWLSGMQDAYQTVSYTA